MGQPARQTEIRLLQERSAGTFARVFTAEALGAGDITRIVAVKVLKEQWADSAEILERMRDEARLLARLQHKNILRVEALAQLEEQPAIVMEFVDGLDLKQLVEQLSQAGTTLPAKSAFQIAHQTASALEAAYFKAPYGRQDPLRVVHRDLKPSNVMVSVSGDVKVLDFGTARFVHEGRQAKTGVMRFGSLRYMSPERRDGERGDHSTDIYALGLMILEMLRGELVPLLDVEPQSHDDVVEKLIAGVGDAGLPNDQWRGSLAKTLRSMCAYQPEHRLNAGQARDLLQAFADQADGDALEKLGSRVVEPLVRSLYATAPDAELRNARVTVYLDGPVDPARATDAGIHVPAPGLEPVTDRLDPPTAVVDPGTDFPEDVEEEVTEKPVIALTSPSAPAPPKDKDNTLIIAAVVVGVGFMFLGAGGAVLAWVLYHQMSAEPVVAEPVVAVAEPIGAQPMVPEPDEPKVADAAPDKNPPAEAPEPTAAPTPDPEPVAPSQFTLSVTADAETIQWVRVSGDDGARVLNADPSATGDLAAGSYRLKAKQVGRGAVEGEIDLSKDQEIGCAIDDGAIRCVSAADGPIELE